MGSKAYGESVRQFYDQRYNSSYLEPIEGM